MAKKKIKTKERTGYQGLASYNLTDLNFIGKTNRSYEVYRLMRRHPTIAIARACATAPIISSNWSLEAADDVPDDLTEFVNEQINNIWIDYLKNAIFALDYGFQVFEKIYRLGDKSGMIEVERLKPLLPDLTKFVVDKQTGELKGVKNNAIELNISDVVVYTHDKEGDNYYGHPRMENCWEAWRRWKEIDGKFQTYITKVSNVIPMIEYPPGESRDVTGATVDNFKIAQSVLRELGKGAGIAMPNTLAEYVSELSRLGGNVKDMRAWNIDFLEVGGSHGSEYETMMDKYERLMIRGWLIPERAISEGKFGTKAEAESHADIALLMTTQTYHDIITVLNEQLVNDLVRYNFGDDYIGKVKIIGSELDKEQQELYREILKGVLTNPNNVDLLIQWLDVDALVDIAGLPKGQDIIDVDNVDIGKKRVENETESKQQQGNLSLASILSDISSEMGEYRKSVI